MSENSTKNVRMISNLLVTKPSEFFTFPSILISFGVPILRSGLKNFSIYLVSDLYLKRFV